MYEYLSKVNLSIVIVIIFILTICIFIYSTSKREIPILMPVKNGIE